LTLPGSGTLRFVALKIPADQTIELQIQ